MDVHCTQMVATPPADCAAVIALGKKKTRCSQTNGPGVFMAIEQDVVTRLWEGGKDHCNALLFSIYTGAASPSQHSTSRLCFHHCFAIRAF